MPSDWWLLGMLGSAGGSALGGLGSAATGLGATGAGSALTSAGQALSTAALPPAAAGAGGAAGSSGIVPALTSAPTSLSTSTLPQSTQVIGAGGTGAGTGAGAGALLPSTPNPSLAELTNVPEVSGGLNVSAPPYQQPTFTGGGMAGSAPSFLSSLLPSGSQLQQGGLDVLAGGHGDYGGGSLLSQAGNALRARVLNSIAGGNQQQMDPQTAAILRALMAQRGIHV
jgi:hypothetical protein